MAKLNLFLFVIFSAILGAFIAMSLSRFFIDKSSGLAGGAAVLGYGIFGLFAGLVLALLFNKRLSPANLKRLNLFFGIGCATIIMWLYYMFTTNRSSDSPHIPQVPTQEERM